MIDVVKVVKISPTRIWSEKDIMGTVHIKMQHEGCEEFNFIQIHYDYAYTSNGHQAELTKRILEILGVPPATVSPSKT